MNASAHVCEFLPKTLSRQESDDFARRIIRHFSAHGFGLYAVELVQTGAFIGYAGFSIPAFDAPFMPAIEIGWRLAFDHWGQGYATEAARRALAHGREELGLKGIVSFTVPANMRSRRVMEKIGLSHDKDGDFDHPKLPQGHPQRRHVLYRMPE